MRSAKEGQQSRQKENLLEAIPCLCYMSPRTLAVNPAERKD